MAKAAMGAVVMYCGHEAYFVADIFEIAGANVVRANGKIDIGKCIKERRNLEHGFPTHHVSDFPQPGFWRPDLGIFVVPSEQVTVVRKTNYRRKK